MQRDDKYGPKTIESFEGLFWLQVEEKVRDKSMWDDCVQEARIKAWQILSEKPDVPRGYIARSTARQIQKISMNGPQTGGTSHRGKPIDPLRRPHSGTDQMQQQAERPKTTGDSRVCQLVRAAIEELPAAQQEYVRERFYEEVPFTKRSRSSRLWYAPDQGARDKLREALRDLAA